MTGIFAVFGFTFTRCTRLIGIRLVRFAFGGNTSTIILLARIVTRLGHVTFLLLFFLLLFFFLLGEFIKIFGDFHNLLKGLGVLDLLHPLLFISSKGNRFKETNFKV